MCKHGRLLGIVVAETEAMHMALLLVQQNGWNNIEIQVNIKALTDCLEQHRFKMHRSPTIFICLTHV